MNKKYCAYSEKMRPKQVITYFIILVLFVKISFGQDSISLDTNMFYKKVSEMVTNDADTFRIEIDKNTKTIIPETEENVNFIIVKEKDRIDFLKYLFPIITLLLGVWIKHLLDRLTEKKRIKKSGKRWISEIRSLEEPIIKQISSLKKFKIEVLNEEFSVPNLTSYTTLEGEVFSSLDKSDLIEYLELEDKKANYSEIINKSNKIHGFINILRYQHETLIDKYNRFKSYTSKHLASLTLSLQNFDIAIRELGIKIEKDTEINPNYDEYYQKIFKLYSTHIKPKKEEGNFNPYILEKEFYVPLSEALNELRLDVRVEKLNVAVFDALNAIKGIKMEKQYMEKNSDIIIKRYKELLEDLKKVVESIEKKN